MKYERIKGPAARTSDLAFLSRPEITSLDEGRRKEREAADLSKKLGFSACFGCKLCKHENEIGKTKVDKRNPVENGFV